MQQEPTIEELADQIYTLLWQRNFTRSGWLKFSAIRRIMQHQLPEASLSRLRSVFANLYQRGHFLKRTLVKGQHCSYLFLQSPLPLGDLEARNKAIEHYRWQSNWSK